MVSVSPDVDREGPSHRYEVNALERFEREPFCRSRRDVDREVGPSPTLVLIGVDVERHARDLAETQVPGAQRKLAVLEAHRGSGVAAAAGLEEHERPLRGAEAMDHLKRRGGGRKGGARLAAVGRHF